MKKTTILVLLVALFSMTGCSSNIADEVSEAIEEAIEENSSSESSSDIDWGMEYDVSSNDIEAVEFDVDDLFSNRDYEVDYDESEATIIDLNSVDDSEVVISEEGTYILSGTLEEGQIIVDSTSETKIQLVLDGVTINNSTSAAIYIKQADKVFITTADGAENVLNVCIDDEISFSEDEDGGTTSIDAAIFSHDDLTLNGLGTIDIIAENGNGITSKDDLVITSGTYNIDVDNHGLEANDWLLIADGTFTIATGEGSANAPDKEESSTSMTMPGRSSSSSNSTTTSSSTDDETTKGKGIKCDTLIYIAGGTFDMDTYNDAIHSDIDTYIVGGTFEILAGDDAITSELYTIIEGGTININYSYEGIEGQKVEISGGDIWIVNTNDGLNSSTSDYTTDDENYISITGGTIIMDCYDEGDGIDANGSVYISGGYIEISGTTYERDTPLDYLENGTITGGTFVATGVYGMTNQNFDSASTQVSVYVKFTNYQDGELVIADSDGNVIISYTPLKEYNIITVSSPELEVGETYTLSVGDESYTIQPDSYIVNYSQSSSSSSQSQQGR